MGTGREQNEADSYSQEGGREGGRRPARMKPIDDDDARIHGRIDENAARGSKCRRGIGGHGRIILDWRKVMRGERGSPAAAGPSLSLSLSLPVRRGLGNLPGRGVDYNTTVMV